MENNYDLYSYYKGEKKSPYNNDKEPSKDFFWYIESMHYENSKMNSDFQIGFV